MRPEQVRLILVPGSRTGLARLSKLSKLRSVSVRLDERSQIVLHACAGITNEAIGKEPGITRQKTSRLRKRYVESGIEGIVGMPLDPDANRKSVHTKLPS